ncbi:MAG: shikimate kinase, partial [Mariprofundaceae bacterium]|nr:shikimate kinase [Mariprofundaceae bacterium]
RLAAHLELPFIDVDEHIVAAAGRSIPDIFAEVGETGFRRLETDALKSVIDENAVIATGGGVVLSGENRNLIRAHPPVIWLDAAPRILAGRIGKNSGRPLMAGVDPLEKARELADIRNPLYAECADFHLRTDRLGKQAAVEAILRFLSEWRHE